MQVLVEFNPLSVAGTLVVSTADGSERTVCGLDDGETFVSEQPETFVAEGVKWRTVGGTVWRPAPDAAGWKAGVSFEGSSYTFVQRGEAGARLVWRQEKVGFAAPSVATDSAACCRSAARTDSRRSRCRRTSRWPTNSSATDSVSERNLIRPRVRRHDVQQRLCTA